MSVSLQIGRFLVDLTNAEATKIDLTAVEQNLWTVRRFSNNPAALVVRQHTKLVATLARLLARGADVSEVALWCEHHDDHEAIIGDIPGPLKHYINQMMNYGPGPTLDHIEDGLDRAICMARGLTYPTEEIRRKVHRFDKLAETLEWQFVLGHPPAAWNQSWGDYLTRAEAMGLCAEAAAARPPEGLL